MAYGSRNINCSYFCWIPEAHRTALWNSDQSVGKWRDGLCADIFFSICSKFSLPFELYTDQVGQLDLKIEGSEERGALHFPVSTWKSWIWTISDGSDFKILKHNSYIPHTALKD